LTEKATRLYPLPPREIPAESIYEGLELPPAGRADSHRPYVIINMVSSVDGKTAIGGKAARIGSQTDRRTMQNLRSHADAVMIGANTLRAEKLSLALDDPSDKPQPLAIIATRTGDVPLESNLILGEEQEVLLLFPREVPGCPCGRARRLLASEGPSGHVDLVEALEMLKAEYGVDVLLVEGGPTLNHALISRGLADELFLTLAPKLLGSGISESRTILDGGPLPQETSTPVLLSVHLVGDELFLRYKVEGSGIMHNTT
jgi:2,5-diamino-6-(ribosylamino)-4(3H)-pyrimidinone 5'-phosphate reductase